jgi:beta-hydroxyacyl-ACP dehydratase FabZ
MEFAMDIQAIMKHLPHRYPFILVDRILEWVPDQRIVGLKNVTINEPFFQGHYPGTPIMPGVLIVEAMGQAGGVLAMASLPEAQEGTLMYFMGFDQVKFRKMVIPGDQLILELEIVKKRAKVIKLEGLAKVDGQVAAEATFMATFEGK